VAILTEQQLLGNKIGRWAIRNLARTVDRLARVLPLSWLRAIATGLAYLIYLLYPSRQRLARENIRKVFGDQFSTAQRRSIALRSTINICQTMIELFKMRYMTPEQVNALVSLEGAEHLRQALSENRGAVVITAHFGNWELAGARFAAEGFPVTVLARDSDEPVAALLINRARQHHNIEVLQREDIRQMIRTLRDNRGLGILPDQHAAAGGIELDFLGRPASTAIGPAVLARHTRCAIVPFFARRLPNGTFHSQVLPPLPLPQTDDRDQFIKQLTQQINDAMSEQIRRYPEQWLWLHDRWKVDPGNSA